MCSVAAAIAPMVANAKPEARGVVDPGMEVLGDDDHVEPGVLCDPGVLDEFFWMPLLVAAEVGELGQRAFLSVLAQGCGPIGPYPCAKTGL